MYDPFGIEVAAAYRRRELRKLAVERAQREMARQSHAASTSRATAFHPRQSLGRACVWLGLRLSNRRTPAQWETRTRAGALR
jgi:hypothetical protein